MPFNSKDKRKEYNRKYYENKKCPQSKAREEYILNFYSTAKTEYDFMIWVRNIKRVNKHLLNRETTQKESEIKEQPNNDALTDCIKSLLKVGEKYVSFHPSPTNTKGIPIFFHITKIEDEKILIDYVNIRFVKCGTGEGLFIPEWEEIIEESVILNKDLFNLRPFIERKVYKHGSYLEIRNTVMALYKRTDPHFKKL